MQPDAHEHGAGHAHSHEAAGGIEWEDDMVELNRMTTPANVRWKLVDRSTGAENQAIDWRFRGGGQGKLRLGNEKGSYHPMNPPFPTHRAARFLFFCGEGAAEPTPP